ncbi:hypothetical protein D3C78_1256530 [compost metagenome]
MSAVKPENATIEMIFAGDILPAYDLTYVGRNYVPEPNYEGKTNSLGQWVGKEPLNVWRHHFRDSRGYQAYYFPHSNTMLRVDETGKVTKEENFPKTFKVIHHPRKEIPLLRSKGK